MQGLFRKGQEQFWAVRRLPPPPFNSLRQLGLKGRDAGRGSRTCVGACEQANRVARALSEVQPACGRAEFGVEAGAVEDLSFASLPPNAEVGPKEWGILSESEGE
jgi:hypothetical protein